MRLAYLTIELRNICEDENIALANYSVAVVGSMQKRIADIIAANNISDLIAGNPRLIKDENQIVLKLDLVEDKSLVFSANHTKKSPKTKSNEIEWHKVNYIQLIKIQ